MRQSEALGKRREAAYALAMPAAFRRPKPLLILFVVIALSVAILGGVWLAHRTYERPEESGDGTPAGHASSRPIGL